MRPYVAEILELRGKTYKLPVPSKYRELLSCAETLGIKEAADEVGLKTVGYESIIDYKPELTDSWYDIENTATALSKLSESQVAALVAVCKAFNVKKFIDLGGVIEKLESLGGNADEED